MKKKSMSTLANLAPRRRDRGDQKEKATNAKEPVTSSVPMKTSGFGIPKSGPALAGSQDQTVDRLASALLESTIFNHPNGLRSHPSVLLCAAEPMSFSSTPSEKMPEMAASLHDLTMGLPSGDDAAHPQSHAQTQETDHSAPDIPRKSSRRRRGERTKDVATDIHPAKRLFPQSKTTMLDAGNKHDVDLPGSTTAPLGGLSKLAVGRMPVANPHAANPNLVSDKVAAMLAATEALKPRGSQEIASSTSKPLRNRRKGVMSKVRQALDIFHSKPATPESKIRGRISAPVALATCNMPNPAVHYHLEAVEEASPVNSIDLRVNEGENIISNRKIQTIVGGCIVRKPIPYCGESFRSGRSSDDPFSEPYEIIRTPTPFEHRLKTSIDSADEVPPIPALNPFASERDFDTDLEGILSEKPLCASTPRARNGRRAAPHESPSKQYLKRDDRHFTASNETGRSAGARGIALRKRKLADSAKLFRDQPDLSVKKHPSPSKDDLNDLETRFRAYAIEQIKKAPAQERQALEIKFAGLIGPNALTPRDRNLSMKSNVPKEDAMDDSNAVAERQFPCEPSVLSSRQSRIPRPVDLATRVPFAPRFAPQRQPTNSDAMEIDELQ